MLLQRALLCITAKLRNVLSCKDAGMSTCLLQCLAGHLLSFLAIDRW
jgi:hypothetical protein